MKQTAMQHLKEDLILSKETTKISLSLIENEEIKDACMKVVELTLNSIIKRIDDELLEMEKENAIYLVHQLTKCHHTTVENRYKEIFK